MKRVDFYLQADLKKQLEKLAKDSGTTVTQLLQLSVRRLVAEKPKLVLQ